MSLSTHSNNFMVSGSDSPVEDSSRISAGDSCPSQLIWSNVSYSIPSFSQLLPPRRATKLILNNVSGSIQAASLTAVMGPSGCGKTSLLNCLTGKIRGSHVSGRICTRSRNTKQCLRIGFVPQHDHLFPVFSVYETIMFADRIGCVTLSGADHELRVNQLLQQLDMIEIAGTRISCLSGGERKRVSIALELISCPEVLVLDEPTSGLDSMNSEAVIQMLKTMTLRGTLRPMVIVSIHQPSSDVFLMLDQIYLLSRNGDNIYSGPPTQVMAYMEQFGCPCQQTNPAEYAIQVANGKFGDDLFQVMAQCVKSQPTHHHNADLIETPIQDLYHKSVNNWFHRTAMLSKRHFVLHTTRQPTLVLRLVILLLQALIMCHLPSQSIGSFDGCILSSNEQVGDAVHQFSSLQTTLVFVNVSIVLQMMGNAFVNLIAFPQEIGTFERESSNSWYSTSSLHAALLLNEAIGVLLSCLVYVSYVFWAGDLPLGAHMFRFWLVLGMTFLVGLLWGGRGLLFSVLFHPHVSIAAAATLSLVMMTTFCSGFFIRISDMIPVMRKVMRVSDSLHAQTIMMSALFGYDRCNPELTSSLPVNHLMEEVLTEKSVLKISARAWPALNVTQDHLEPIAAILNLSHHYFDPILQELNDRFGSGEVSNDAEDFQSFVMSMFDVQESEVGTCFVYLIGLCAVTRILAFVALAHKCKR